MYSFYKKYPKQGHGIGEYRGRPHQLLTKLFSIAFF